MKLKIIELTDTPKSYLETRTLLEAQAKLTMRQIMEWGEEICPHAFASKSSSGEPWLRRECSECWQALQEGESRPSL